MDGRNNVFVIAATNRPEMIDPAMLRPGRLDKALYVDLPTAKERMDILVTVSRSSPLSLCVSLKQVAEDSRCDGFSGADLSALVREAGVSALRRVLVKTEDGISFSGDANDIFIIMNDFWTAFDRVVPSVSKKNRRKYELMKFKFGNGLKVEDNLDIELN